MLRYPGFPSSQGVIPHSHGNCRNTLHSRGVSFSTPNAKCSQSEGDRLRGFNLEPLTTGPIILMTPLAPAAGRAVRSRETAPIRTNKYKGIFTPVIHPAMCATCLQSEGASRHLGVAGRHVCCVWITREAQFGSTKPLVDYRMAGRNQVLRQPQYR